MLEEEGLGVSVRIAQSPKRPNVMAVRVAGRGSPAIELHHKPTPEKLLRLHFPHPRNMHSGGTAQEHNHLMSANSNLRDADIHGDEQSRPIRRADVAHGIPFLLQHSGKLGVSTVDNAEDCTSRDSLGT